MPLVGITTLSSVMLPLTSCGNNGGGEQTKEIELTYSKPVVDKDFVITYKLKSGYRIDTTTSKIVFGTTNGTTEVTINYCTVTDTTITVPATYVKSETVNVQINTIAKHDLTKDEVKTAVKAVFEETDSRNAVVDGSGTFYIKNDDESYNGTGSIKISMNKKNYLFEGQGNYDDGETINEKMYDVVAEDYGRYWVLPKLLTKQDKYFAQGASMSMYGLALGMTDKTLEQNIDAGSYNSTLDCFTFPFYDVTESPYKTQVIISFVFDTTKALSRINCYVLYSYKDEITYEVNYNSKVTKGTAGTISLPSDIQRLKVSSTEFTEWTEHPELPTAQWIYSYASDYNPLKECKVEIDLSKYTHFDPAKTTKITGWFGQKDYEKFLNIKLFKNDNTEMVRGVDYEYKSSGNYYLEFKPNSLKANDMIKIVKSTFDLANKYQSIWVEQH